MLILLCDAVDCELNLEIKKKEKNLSLFKNDFCFFFNTFRFKGELKV